MIHCSYIRCRTGLPGIVIPIASFKAKNGPVYLPRGHAILGELRLCEACAVTAKIHDIITDKRWADICHQIAAAGGTEPDRDSLQMVLGSPKDKPLPPLFVEAIQRMRKELPQA